MRKKPKLSIIIVNYRSAELLRRCLRSLKEKITTLPFEVVVVHNSDEDISFVEELNNASIEDMSSNVGFACACNKGFQRASSPYIAFINPDTELLSRNISHILDRFEEDDDLGVIGAGLFSNKGAVQEWAAGKDTHLLDILLNNAGLVRSRNVWESKSTRLADWVSGAALFAKKEVFDEVQGFDEDFFMYFEDQDLCRRIRSAGYKVAYEPSIEFLHIGSGSFSQDRSAQKKHYYTSQDIFFRKHYTVPHAIAIKALRKLFVKNG